MMSTAILMAMGAEQSGKQLTALDVENSDRPTFAQVLDTRVGISPAVSGKDSRGTVLHEAPNEKIEPDTKNEGHELTLAAGAKARMFAGHSKSTQVESKDINVANTTSLRPLIVSGTKVQKKTEETETQAGEPVENTEETRTEPPTVAKVALGSNLRTERVIPLNEQVEGNQIQLPPIQTPVIQREALGRVQVAASEKKVASKTEVGDANQTNVPAKSGAVTGSPTAEMTKSIHGAGVQAIAVTNQITGQAVAASAAPVAASNVPLSVENGKNGAGSGAAALSGDLSSGTVSAASEGSGSKNALHGSKTSTSDGEATQAPPGAPVVIEKPDVKEERSQTEAMNAGADSDAKTRSARDISVTAVHTQAPGSQAAEGSLTPVVGGLTRPSGSEGGSTSAASSTNGMREEDGSGDVARFAEPMPRTLSASPTALEVGIPDGTQGWLKVRAEMSDGGAVNASVSAVSLASQEMLHRELPSLTAYLQSEKVTVNTVVVHPTASAGAEARGYSAGPESEGSGYTPQQNSEGRQQQNFSKEIAEDLTSYRGLQGDEDGMSPLVSYESSRSWLSIRA